MRREDRLRRRGSAPPPAAAVSPGARDSTAVLDLQRSAGNAAVSSALARPTIQRGVLDWAKQYVGGEKTNLEVTAEEMDAQLGTTIEWLDRAKVAAEVVGKDQFSEGLGGVSEGLGKVRGPISKVLKAQSVAREVRQFYDAVKRLQTIDLNRDYEAGAEAMSDLAEAAGKLGGRLVPEEAGAVGAYLELVQNSGAIFKMGARLRKQREAMIDPDAYFAELEKERAAQPAPPKAAAKQTVTFAELWKFVDEGVDRGVAEVQSKTHNPTEGVTPGIYRDRFRDAYNEFLGFYQQRSKLGFLGSFTKEHKSLTWQMREPWKAGADALFGLERWLGSSPHTDVSFIPAIKAWEGLKP
jgi:hypothetical protein